jgi:hypothetical protein
MPIAINGSGSITGISAGGLPDACIVKADLAANAVAFVSYAIIADQKAQNTAGGTFTSGAWRTRDLNTEIADPDGIVSISSNQFTLGVGSYLIRWRCPALKVARHQTKLYNITTAADVQVGGSFFTDPTSDNTMNSSMGTARVTLAGTTVFEIQHRCTSTYASQGFGIESNLTTEQYSLVEIFKES